jgi:hypothetical protein
MGVYLCRIIFLQAWTSSTVRGISLAVVAAMASAQRKGEQTGAGCEHKSSISSTVRAGESAGH